MLTMPPSVKIFVYTRATDMRRSFDGLFALTRDAMRLSPLSGHMFVFSNRRQDRVKILFWDRSGFWILYKRLEKGVFRFPRDGQETVEIDAVDLSLVLEGISLSGAKRRPNWTPGTSRRLSAA